MDEVETAYAAGLFDGEGSVGFYWRKASKNGKRYGKLMARVSQNDRRVLDWLASALGVGTVHARKVRQPARLTGRARLGHHDFVVVNEAARVFLAAIRPYLKIKAEIVDEKLALDREHCRRRAKETT